MLQVLISRNYRGDIDLGVIEKFMPLLMEKEEEGMLTPMLQTTECTFSYIKYNNLYIVSTTKKNANIALVFVFLHKIVQVIFRLIAIEVKQIVILKLRNKYLKLKTILR